MTGPTPSQERRTVGAEYGAQNQTANSVIAYLITGPALGGLGGWGLGSLLHTDLLIPVGLLLGMGLSLYVIWLRYGMS